MSKSIVVAIAEVNAGSSSHSRAVARQAQKPIDLMEQWTGDDLPVRIRYVPIPDRKADTWGEYFEPYDAAVGSGVDVLNLSGWVEPGLREVARGIWTGG